MKCSACSVEVTGEIYVSEDEINGTCIIRMEASADRDWIACDSCNVIVCHNCATYPESGYCDGCITKYQLKGYLVDQGLICEGKSGQGVEDEN